MKSFESAYIKRTCLCGWCRVNDDNHGVEEYVGKYTDEPCEDCGEYDDVREVIIVGIGNPKLDIADRVMNILKENGICS